VQLSDIIHAQEISMSFTKKNIFILALCVQISSLLMPAEERTPTLSKSDLDLMEIGAQGAVFTALYYDLLALTRTPPCPHYKKLRAPTKQQLLKA